MSNKCQFCQTAPATSYLAKKKVCPNCKSHLLARLERRARKKDGATKQSRQTKRPIQTY